MLRLVHTFQTDFGGKKKCQQRRRNSLLFTLFTYCIIYAQEQSICITQDNASD